MLFIRDLPPVTTVNLPVDEPSIYFGELSNDYVLVGTNTPEFHYPRGERQRHDDLPRLGRRVGGRILCAG